MIENVKFIVYLKFISLYFSMRKKAILADDLCETEGQIAYEIKNISKM